MSTSKVSSEPALSPLALPSPALAPLAPLPTALGSLDLGGDPGVMIARV